MSRPPLFHPSGPSTQATTSPSPGQRDLLLDSPSSFSSPASSFASGSVMASPATVYSDSLYQTTSRPQAGGGSHQGPFVEFVRAHAKGVIRFRPFEDGLDAVAMKSIEEFQIYPFGSMEDFCRHIPYASGKKDFFEKTGRESFEVFQYTFKVPGDDKEYHVMWDYNIGLVRMTPFFKCCKYSKTTPAKMLNLNPGLRDITHSITGGSIMAQGYWMPYSCAKAVCATFCYHIAGALIPVFGPDFPSECLPPQSQDFARMVINPVLVAEATREAEHMRELNLHALEASALPPSFHPGHMHYQPIDSPRDLPRQRDLHLLPPNTHRHVLPPMDSTYDRPVSGSTTEIGPQLAPINYAVARHEGPLLPSPIEHERLPPLSHITGLSPLTLPPLFSRENYERGHCARPPRSSQHFSYGSHRHSYSRADASATAMDKRSSWDCALVQAPAPVPPTRHVHTMSVGCEPEHANSATNMDAQDNRQTYQPSSYCYPSPPRRQYSPVHYASEIKGGQPVLFTPSTIKAEEDCAPGASMEGVVHRQTQQKMTTKRRILRVRGSGMGTSTSSSTWSATDVDAAKVLVNFSVEMESKTEGEQESDSDNNRPDCLNTRECLKNEPRFSGSIASLLCNDESPRKKRSRN